MDTKQSRASVDLVVRHHPVAQAVYLFGSYGTPDPHAESDADIGLPQESGEAFQILAR